MMAALRRCLSKLRINCSRYALYQSGLKQKDTQLPRPLTSYANEGNSQIIHPASSALTNFCRTCTTSAASENKYQLLRIENLPKLISKSDVETFLEKHGAVDCRKQGIRAIVKFSKPEMVYTAADNLNGIVFEGFQLKVMASENKCKLRILNVPEEWDAAELEQLCKPYGEVLDTSISSVWLANFNSALDMETAASVLQGSTFENTVIRAKACKLDSREKGPGPYDVFRQRDYTPRVTDDTQDMTTESDGTDELYRSVVLEVKSHDVAVLNSYTAFVKITTRFLNINVVKIYTPPKAISKYTLLKSVHIYKKHRVQYEMRTNFRVIELEKLTGSTANTFLEYIERNLPEGVAMKVTKFELQTLPEHIVPPQPELTA
ncbi:uncharacterized protein LOC110450999 isoform X2 [Mizuhopecten yessoensis]|uniref:Small ribosomal subunit protein uS10m n=1 Tax=Mizuhopecten yessoensis TaxID=6573 RepID=A0A210QMN4_MIZYE|nr:uncharacterized protein LOC110450999 isoform X2 [Mizuhopecten yessoensis]OWF49994.1 28S ribosomal protein S10, mitochondrial [Mizuhopecten yessoensis]